jgi:hypothetical protein
MERELIGWYESVVETCLEKLTPENADAIAGILRRPHADPRLWPRQGRGRRARARRDGGAIAKLG